ncbi:hypothetical protein [Photorhabdus aegyptia]|nr:hypothetical protein [Photorhabdus aegyptia]
MCLLVGMYAVADAQLLLVAALPKGGEGWRAQAAVMMGAKC